MTDNHARPTGHYWIKRAGIEQPEVALWVEATGQWRCCGVLGFYLDKDLDWVGLRVPDSPDLTSLEKAARWVWQNPPLATTKAALALKVTPAELGRIVKHMWGEE